MARSLYHKQSDKAMPFYTLRVKMFVFCHICTLTLLYFYGIMNSRKTKYCVRRYCMAQMTKTNYTGVYQLDNNRFCYRLNINKKGVKIDTTCRLDQYGQPFTTKTAARDAYEKAKAEALQLGKLENKHDYRLGEIYDLYMKKGTAEKAHATIQKQKSMWENHIGPRFAKRYIKNISVGELNDYLAELYVNGDDYNDHKEGYAYKYVEGFLKFFYLLFGYAYRYDAYDTEKYTKYFVEKNTRIQMPKIRQEDNEDNVKVFIPEEVLKMWERIKGTNFAVPFALGYFLGTRLSETYALRWSSINWDKNKITIDGQLLYQDKMWVIAPVKTLTAVREIYMPATLKTLLRAEYDRQQAEQVQPYWRANEKIIDIRERNNHKTLVGGDFICRKEKGELCTTNSVKYWVKVFADELGIDFDFHSLRKTHLTMLANLNTPLLEFQLRSGHKKISTAQKYYIDRNRLAKEQLKRNVEMIQFGGYFISGEDEDGGLYSDEDPIVFDED